MSAWLIDTNVISEARKRRGGNPGVRAFLQQADPVECYLPVQVVGEIRRGVERIRRRGDTTQAGLLENWLEQLVTEYAGRILDFDQECAQAWGSLMALEPGHAVDAQIAAMAGLHQLTVVTRNTADFAATGVHLHNPFT